MPDAMTYDFDLTRRTPGEELFLWRRQQGLNQVAAAKRLRVNLGDFKNVELGKTFVASSDRIRGHDKVTPTTGDLCRLARRRSSLELRDAAAAVGISHRWILHWERAGDARLVDWWKGRGYIFEKDAK